jgi:hypothetical protein
VADILTDGNTKVAFVATIASKSAPTAAELTAGTDLQHYITADGLISWEPTTSEVDATALDSTFNLALPGRVNFSGAALRFKKQSGTDAVFDLLDTKDTRGYIVFRRGLAAGTAWAVSQDVEVYPVATGQWFPLPAEANSLQRYQVPFTITDDPVLNATVA